MSFKTGVFNIGMFPSPQTKCNFLVLVPKLTASTLYVMATSYPKIGIGSVAIPFRGERIYRPTVPDVEGVWKCQVPESQLMLMRELINIAQTKVDPFRGMMYRLGWAAVIPLSTMNIPTPWVTLGDCWLKCRESVDLNYSEATSPWVWNLEFHFSFIKEKSWKMIDLEPKEGGGNQVKIHNNSVFKFD